MWDYHYRGGDPVSKKKVLKCVECGFPAKRIDRVDGYDEPVCEGCAKDRAWELAERLEDFTKIKDLDKDEFASLIEWQEEIENGQA